jgi:hypothetical protein
MKHPRIKSYLQLTALLGGLAAYGTAQAAPTISSVYPDGSLLFQASPTFSFVAASSSGVTGVTVQLTANTLMGGQSSFKTLRSGAGLTVSGADTSETVSCSLITNVLYTAVIQVTDASGTTSSTVNFDTLAPVYTWEAEDWDYTTNGLTGQFFDNPQTNAYAGLLTTGGTDAYHTSGGGGNPPYRPVGSTSAGNGLATESTGDTPRAQYNNTGKTDYDVGWNNGGDWGNYTRHYPAGTYYVVMRGSDGGGQASDSASVSVAHGSAVLTSTAGGATVSVPNIGGWQSYSYLPYVDSSTNPVTLTFDGSASTLRMSTDGGSYNVNFYMLMPTNQITLGAPADAAVANPFPNGTNQFQWTNTFSFAVNSTHGISPQSVVVELLGTNLQGSNVSQTLTSSSGLTITGPSTSLNVSGPLTSNTAYTAVIQITDYNGNGLATNITFDTIIPFYTFEAEDWDYSTGQYYDNPQLDSYQNLDGGTPGIDDNNPDSITSIDLHQSYRGDYGVACLETEGCNDTFRTNYNPNAGWNDFDIGNTVSGAWGNYTRNYPAGTYNIYVRASRGSSGTQTDAGSVSQLLSGYQTSSQTLSKLGTYDVPYTANWQKYVFCPVKTPAGDLARFHTDGSLQTLRVTMDNAGHNMNYFLLMPADLTQNPPPYISTFTPDGSSLFQDTNELSFVVNSSVGIAQSGVVLNLDGTVVSGLTFGGTPYSLTASYPVRTNSYHTAIITVTDSAGTASYTNSFATFDASDYQWEAEDYDYNGGHYYDNPQVDAYQGLAPVSGVDCLESDANAAVGGSFTYRPSPSGALAIPASSTSDGQRSQFTTGTVNYNIGFFGNGSWANYTRTYPAGTYNVYGRFAEGAGATAAQLLQVVTGYGTPSQTTSPLGIFNIPEGGWSTYEWAPLTDVSGNLARVTLTGSQTTLRLAGYGSGPEVNVDFLMLVPADLTVPVIANVSPDGSTFFQDSNKLSFAVSSAAGIKTNSVVVTLNGATVSGLVFTGNSTSWNVSASGLHSNTIYTAVITATTLGGATITLTNTFDTFSSANYQFEAEDYDYNGGHYYDSPTAFAYYGLSGIAGIDYVESDVNAVNGPHDYRPAPNIPTSAAGDGQRSQFTGSDTNYNIGFFGGGSWANYTRHYPLGTYAVWGRFAEGASATEALVYQVVNGVGSSNQSTSLLGTFQIPESGWSTWEWVPLTDNAGNVAKVTFDGTPATLRLGGTTVADLPEVNVDFMMLVPTTPAPRLTAVVNAGQITVSFVTQSGYSYQVLYKNNLSAATWTPLGSAITGNNTVQAVTDTAASASRFYYVQVH